MVSLRKPAAEAMRRSLLAQEKLPWSYRAVGATAETPPPGYVVDRTRVDLGQGEAVFRAAKAALERWDHFRLGWVETWPPDIPIVSGQVLAVLGRVVGLWWLNCCRIVYVIDETGTNSAFGFAYGTLPAHVESGEERFLIRWDHRTDRVCYDVLAFSRPHHVMTRLGYPLVRRHQKRFGRDSAAAIYRAVNGALPMPPVWQQTG
jgi:uncharacterized protein (UPF0548 family)